MKVDDDGILPAVPELTSIVCGNVESQLEAGGARAIAEGSGSEVAEEGGCWGGWLGEGMQPEADAGEESPGAGLDSEKAF